MTGEFSEKIFEKYSNVKFYKKKNSVRWEQNCSMRMDRHTNGQTDSCDKANSRFSQLRERT